MNICLGVAFRNAQELVDCVPLILRQQNRRFGQAPEIDAFNQRETAFIVNWKGSSERRTGRPELLIAFFEHFAKTMSGSLVPSLFKLIGEKCGIVTDLVYIKTKGSINDTKQLCHEASGRSSSDDNGIT